MGTWQHIFKKKGKVFLTPEHEMSGVLKLLKRDGAKRVLDLGCGSGRHTIQLARRGFDVCAVDISDEGLKLTKQWLRKAGLAANVKKASCYKRFPFSSGYFDAVISTYVIHHNYVGKVRFCVAEISRVLRPGGVVYIVVAARKNRFDSSGSKLVAPRTYVPIDGDEKGLPHYIYNKALLMKDFRDFRILSLHKNKELHYCLLGMKR